MKRATLVGVASRGSNLANSRCGDKVSQQEDRGTKACYDMQTAAKSHSGHPSSVYECVCVCIHFQQGFLIGRAGLRWPTLPLGTRCST